MTFTRTTALLCLFLFCLATWLGYDLPMFIFGDCDNLLLLTAIWFGFDVGDKFTGPNATKLGACLGGMIGNLFSDNFGAVLDPSTALVEMLGLTLGCLAPMLLIPVFDHFFGGTEVKGDSCSKDDDPQIVDIEEANSMDNEHAWRCDYCGSKEVESREWVDLSTGRLNESSDLDLNSTWCRKCEGEEGASWTKKEDKKK